MKSKVVFVGGPKTGKTTAATELSSFIEQRDGKPIAIRHTDELISQGITWSGESSLIAAWLDAPGPYIIEGVAAVRALRKWIELAPRAAKPCDYIFIGEEPLIPLRPGQEKMFKACMTIWRAIAPELVMRGAVIFPLRKAAALAKIAMP